MDLLSCISSVFSILFFFFKAQWIHAHLIHDLSLDQNASFFPFIIMLINCIIWVKYGIEISDHTTIFVNTIGLLLSCYSVLVFYYLIEAKDWIEKQIIFSFVLVYGYLFALKLGLIAWSTLGPLSCCVTLLMMIAPLGSTFFGSSVPRLLGKIFRASSPSHRGLVIQRPKPLPLRITISSFLSSTSWALYGLSFQDEYIFYPNMIAAVIGFGQISFRLLWARFDVLDDPKVSPSVTYLKLTSMTTPAAAAGATTT